MIMSLNDREEQQERNSKDARVYSSSESNLGRDLSDIKYSSMKPPAITIPKKSKSANESLSETPERSPELSSKLRHNSSFLIATPRTPLPTRRINIKFAKAFELLTSTKSIEIHDNETLKTLFDFTSASYPTNQLDAFAFLQPFNLSKELYSIETIFNI